MLLIMTIALLFLIVPKQLLTKEFLKLRLIYLNMFYRKCVHREKVFET